MNSSAGIRPPSRKHAKRQLGEPRSPRVRYPRRSPPPLTGLSAAMLFTLSSFAVLGTLLPRAHAFMGVLSFSDPSRSREGPVDMFERRSDAVAAPTAIRPGVRPQRGAERLLMASEEVRLGGIELQLW